MTAHGRLRIAVVVVAAVAMTVTPSPSEARPKPLRSGTIVSGVFTTSPAWSCSWVPDCAAWLASGCNPVLSGRDPAWLASIEKVANLADGTTPRVFVYGPGRPAGLDPGGVTLEFWTKGCRRVGGGVRTWSTADYVFHRRTELTIPVGAAWMTVTANDKLNMAWTLS